MSFISETLRQKIRTRAGNRCEFLNQEKLFLYLILVNRSGENILLGVPREQKLSA